MLEICYSLVQRIDNSEIPDKQTFKILASHQFSYRIFPRMRAEFPHNLETSYCSICGHDHGLPKRLCELIKAIHERINNKESLTFTVNASN